MRIIYGEDIGKTIPDERVRFFDGFLYIIYGDKCKKMILDAEFSKPISLDEISRLCPNVEKVIFEDPFHGWIYSYGNHNKGEWELIGETLGYA